MPGVSDSQSDPLNALWTVYRSVPIPSSGPDASFAALELNSAFERLHALELQRHLRHLSGESTLPWIFWPLLLMGGVIVVGFTYFFHQESHVSQALMTGVVTALLSGVLLLIFALNQPFTGPVPVSKLPFEHALAEFQLLDQTR